MSLLAWATQVLYKYCYNVCLSIFEEKLKIIYGFWIFSITSIKQTCSLYL